jgi:DeoR/GlpR family transcriptional regulator of sugar metabolism
MFAAERRRRILALLSSNGAMGIREIAGQLSTSEVTVRRDLRALEAEGLLDRRHGGAMLPGGFSHEPSYSEKARVAAAEKAAIAELAASELVREGDAVVLGAGTTTQALAHRLTGFRELTVVTNSILVASALAGARGVEVVVTGGTLRGSIHALVGVAAEQSLVGLRTARAFISGNGLTAARGLSTPSNIVASIDRALVATAAEVVVLADHTKVGVDTMCQTVPVERITHLVTDAGAADAGAELDALALVGAHILIASPRPK